MKLVEILSEFRRAGSVARNLVTYPGQMLYQRSRYFFERSVEQIDLPIGRDKSSNNPNNQINQRIKEQVQRYKKLVSKSQKTKEQKSKKLKNKVSRIVRETNEITRIDTAIATEIPPVEIPALAEGQEIRGRKGRYKCSGEIIKAEERIRVYKGVHVQTNKPVVIKEYLLFDKDYNQQERIACKEKFAHLSNISFRNGSSQDFRIISPFETIAPPREKRCYLVSEPIDNSIPLREYLNKQASVNPKQIVALLDQVLQTLWFLHTNRIRLFAGEIEKGIAHGNLNLDTISVAIEENCSATQEPQLFAYLSDLSLWENIFIPPNSPVAKTSFSQDLIDLGTICFYLLSGNVTDPASGQPLAPTDEENWPCIDNTLEDFIKRLLRLNGQFESALAARQELLKLLHHNQFEYQNAIAQPDGTEEESDSEGNETKVNKVLAAFLILGTIGLIGLSSYFTYSRIFNKQARADGDNSEKNTALCCVTKVKIPAGKYTYAVENGVWGYLFKNPGGVSQNKTLNEELELRDPRLKNYQVSKSNLDEIEAVKKGEVDFALTRWNDNLPDNLEQKVVAYHGLVVFVAFSDEQRQQNIPKALKGKISLEQLRSLYTGDTKNWKAPRELKNWDVKLYVPFESEAINLFEELLFDKENSRKIDDYRNLVDKIRSRQVQELQKERKYQLTTRYLLEEVLKDFESRQTVGIGFSFLSTIFGQCAVYPVGIENGKGVIQTLAKTNGDPISLTTDLCNDKGGYWPNVKAFKIEKYPLGYRLVVVYPKGKERSLAGQKFAEQLQTDEGQYLLREAGLVPMRNLP